MFRLRFRISLPEGVAPRATLALVLLLALLLVVPSVSRVGASAPASPSAPGFTTLGVRQFYLTKSIVLPTEAHTVCAPGYHFASIWEIADPSALKYNASLGATSADSGAGPPTRVSVWMASVTARGWVRTGYSYSTDEYPGQANCGRYLSNVEGHWGTVANLVSDWASGEQDIGPWNTEVRTCDTNVRVWCVQDDSVLQVFLPLVSRDDRMIIRQDNDVEIVDYH